MEMVMSQFESLNVVKPPGRNSESRVVAPNDSQTDSLASASQSFQAPRPAAIAADPFFGVIQVDGVFFYDPNRSANIATQLAPRTYAASAPEINIGPIQFFLSKTARTAVERPPG